MRGLGAVLSQPQSNQKLHPIAFSSCSFTLTEKNYSITELEISGFGLGREVVATVRMKMMPCLLNACKDSRSKPSNEATVT